MSNSGPAGGKRRTAPRMQALRWRNQNEVILDLEAEGVAGVRIGGPGPHLGVPEPVGCQFEVRGDAVQVDHERDAVT